MLVAQADPLIHSRVLPVNGDVMDDAGSGSELRLDEPSCVEHLLFESEFFDRSVDVTEGVRAVPTGAHPVREEFDQVETVFHVDGHRADVVVDVHVIPFFPLCG